MLTDDFYGGIQGKSLEVKKLKTLEIYRYFYRFSYEKLVQIINNPFFLIMILQYLKSDKMRRIHSRPVFQRNLKNYYRALENLININEMKPQILSLIARVEILTPDMYEIGEDGMFSAEKLYQINIQIPQQIVEQNDEDSASEDEADE